MRSFIATALLAIALTVATSACGNSNSGSATKAAPEVVDELVATDGGRLHIHCDGSGTTTVLLIAGWDTAGDESWHAVEPAIAERARVCTYDRLGTGTSDRPATTQTFATQAVDLHAMLDKAGEPGPYVVVGHSFGGAAAVSFTSRYRGDVVGLMLIDASPPTWPAAMCAVPDDGTDAAKTVQSVCARYHDPTSDAERLDVFPAFDEVATIRSLGDVPMTVITAAQRTLPPGLADREVGGLTAAWNEGVAHWASLSTSSNVVSVENTSHNIQLDHPDVVMQALGDLLS